MTLFEIVPILSGLATALYVFALIGNPEFGKSLSWTVPAALSAAFLAWTIFAVLREGPTGFWPVHTVSAWGNQIWVDLLLAASIALGALAPAARAQGMRVAPWAILVLCTGSIGLLAMVSRIFYLKRAAG